MIGVKMNTFSDSSSEPEQDANSALTELDKGLRSGKVGEQCEAIVRFPRLFEKYPFPILINSSFLKLADVFRMGNNFLRLWVLRVCQQSEKHLDKILNVDEFLRRVFSVIHSNDPVARALTLKTLGAVAGIIPERQNVHHAIRRALDSDDEVEVDAAIYATTRFAAHSNAFAVAMCNKLSDMIECESTGAERRAKLVLALRTVHGGAIRAQGVLKLLRSLLVRFPSASAVKAAIVAITAITADTVVHVPDQVELLVSVAERDARAGVRAAALAGLGALAAHAALWPPAALRRLPHVPLAPAITLALIKKLVDCPSVFGPAQIDAIAEYCAEAILSSDLHVAAAAAAVFTKITVHWNDNEGCFRLNPELMLALEGLVQNTAVDDSERNIKSLSIALKCLVQLSQACPEAYALRSATLISLQLESCARDRVVRRLRLWEGAAALGGGARGGGAAAPAAIAAQRALMDAGEQPLNTDDPDIATCLVLICTVVFQERAYKALSMKLDSTWEQAVMDALRCADGWTRYRVAVAALRYAHHSVAAKILSRLSEVAESESTQRWLSTLCRIATADKELVERDPMNEDECALGISGLGCAASQWEVASSMAGSCAGAGACSLCAGCAACCALPAAALAARAAAAHALHRAAAAARALCTQPPPAIAQASRDSVLAASGAGAALRRAGAALMAAGNKYLDIARTAFHADDATLTSLRISQQTYTQFAQFLFRITNSQDAPTDLFSKEVQPRTLEEVIALAPSVEMTKIADKLFNNPTTGQGITHRHAEAVLACVRACCAASGVPRGVLAGRGGGAPCRLALSPPRAAADHAPALPTTHRLALHVEGVLLPPRLISKRQQPRKVKSVQLTVTAIPHPRTSEKTVELTNIPPVLTAVQTVTPVKDFFSAQQLISVNTPGLYTVAVESAFVDENGELWNTGPKSSIVIKAHEDPNAKGNSTAARGRF